MYRDGSGLISACVVALVLYGTALLFVLPDATIAFRPDEPSAEVLDARSIDPVDGPYPDLIGDEVGNDPDLPTTYTVEPIEVVGPVLSE